MLLIRNAPQVKGGREPICKTDEATVSRIHAPGTPYDCMVERLQKIPEKGRSTTHFEYGTEIPARQAIPYCLNDKNAQYHVLKFLALGAARLLFPHNFVSAAELRLFERRGERFAATYSYFVPDESGVIERLKTARRRFYGAATREGMDAVRSKSDAEERRRNPRLESLVGVVELQGTFTLAHPEANYHIARGNTVFFEVQGISIAEALALGQRLRAYPETSTAGVELLDIIAAIHATLINQWLGDGKHDWARGWAGLDFDALRDMLLRVYLKTEIGGKPSLSGISMVEKVTKMLRHPPEFWFVPAFIGPLERPSVIIEPGVWDFL